jgi:hypothetical protein
MQIGRSKVKGLLGLAVSAVLSIAPLVHGQEAPRAPHSSARDDASESHKQQEAHCQILGGETPFSGGLENVQIETSDIRSFEQFFELVFQTPPVEQIEHPGTDSLRGYCYRGVLIIVRQDFRTPRPTGWVQLNFKVQDVAAVQEKLESAYRMSPLFQLQESEKSKIVRFHLKANVMRSGRQVTRLEVSGPEGFMIGFDQAK